MANITAFENGPIRKGDTPAEWHIVTAQEFMALAERRTQFYIVGRNDRVYRIRSNGAVKTWKTRPGHFSAPFKIGLRECFRIDHDNIGTFGYIVLTRED